jgi:hypothetical protein
MICRTFGADQAADSLCSRERAHGNMLVVCRVTIEATSAFTIPL